MQRHASWAVAVAALLAAAPGAAAAGDATLTMSAPPDAPRVGQPLLVQAAGSMPAVEVPWLWYLQVLAIPGGVAPACPAGFAEATQIAASTGGRIVTMAARLRPDAAGMWTLPLGLTPWRPGPVLVCGYVNDGLDYTFTLASLVLDVRPVLVRPANVRVPRVRRLDRTVACAPGSWRPQPRAHAYSWLVDGVPRPGAAGRTLRVTPSLRGHTVRCVVRASNAAGSAVATSGPLRLR